MQIIEWLTGVNVVLNCAAVVYLIKVEHRFTELETLVALLMAEWKVNKWNISKPGV